MKDWQLEIEYTLRSIRNGRFEQGNAVILRKFLNLPLRSRSLRLCLLHIQPNDFTEASLFQLGNRDGLVSLNDGAPGTTEQHRESDSGYDRYNMLNTIDRGSYGIVDLVCRKEDPTKTYARKLLPRARVIENNMIKKEVDLIRKARHQHIVQVVDELIDADGDFYNVVMAPAADCDLEKYLRCKVRRPSPPPPSKWDGFGPLRLRRL